MNNFEKIKAMDIDEMAMFFANLSKRCVQCTYYDDITEFCFNEHCYENTKQWLQKESEV